MVEASEGLRLLWPVAACMVEAAGGTQKRRVCAKHATRGRPTVTPPLFPFCVACLQRQASGHRLLRLLQRPLPHGEAVYVCLLLWFCGCLSALNRRHRRLRRQRVERGQLPQHWLPHRVERNAWHSRQPGVCLVARPVQQVLMAADAAAARCALNGCMSLFSNAAPRVLRALQAVQRRHTQCDRRCGGALHDWAWYQLSPACLIVAGSGLLSLRSVTLHLLS